MKIGKTKNTCWTLNQIKGKFYHQSKSLCFLIYKITKLLLLFWINYKDRNKTVKEYKMEEFQNMMQFLSLTLMLTLKKSRSSTQQDSRPNQLPSEREENPLPIHLELLHAFIPIDQSTRKVSAITATTSSVDLTCALCAHI